MDRRLMERRLAAILAVDVVGYSRKMGEEEEATLTALRECRAILQGFIAAASGHVINTAGDSALVEFPSVVGAVRCVEQFQKAVRARNTGRATRDQMEFRAGVHQGEIVHEGDDSFGDGINIAVRLESVAAPGGIAVSERVHDDVAGKLDLSWEDGGEIPLKNIVRPVRVWFAGGRPKTVSTEDGARPSVAVLPFLNAQADQTLCDGITEDVINGLARFRPLYVSGRSSSFAFRESRENAQVIARKLGVAYLVEGTVRQSTNRLRVTTQLLDARAGTTLWAERYDRPLTDIFDVQDEIATTIVGTLAGRIESTQADMSFRKPPASLAAYDLLLRGVSRFRSYDARSNQEAIDFFRQAIAADPGYAQAYCYLALSSLAAEGYAGASKPTRETAVTLARKGVEISPQDATCQRLLGHVLLYDRDYDLAEHHARRAVQLNPNDSDGLISMGYLLVQRGRPEDALGFMDQAVRLNPFHPPWYFAQIAAAHFSLERYQDSIAASRKLPDPQGWSFRLAAAYAKLGRQKEAEEEAEKVLRASPGFTVGDFMATTILLEREDDRERLRDGLLRAGLPA